MELVRHKKTRLNIELTPLIDVVFQLLVFFMLTSTFVQPLMKIDLPRAMHEDKQMPSIVMVSISESGEIWVADKLSSFDQLTQDLQEQLSKQDIKAVNIKGDKNMPYSLFVQAMDLARGAGALQVNIVHEGE